VDDVREFLRSLIDGASVTECRPDGDDAVIVDHEVLAAADLLPLERVTVTNTSRALRFETVCAAAPPGGGAVVCSGAAAGCAAVGDQLVIAAYAELDREDLPYHVARVVELGEDNRVRAVVARTPFDIQG
jgi:aspartate 1-decarboxylase